MAIQKLIIGSRDSKLALIQTYWVRDRLLETYPELEIEIKEIKTQGDKILDQALSKIGGKALFTKELENELLAETIDLAVHSMKDLPTQLPAGLELAATSCREDVRDVVCFSDYSGVKSLEQAKVIGTSSLRRIAQLKNKYPQIEFVDIRGNLQTRFKKLNDPANKLDGIVLAAAGLHRLDMQDQIGEYLDPNEILPAVGQGALGVEIKSTREELRDLIRQAINSREDELVLAGERAFLRKLEGGCQVPIGISCHPEPEGRKDLLYTGLVSSLDGSKIYQDQITGNLEDAEKLGQELAEKLLAQGAAGILQELKV
ncbi:MAG: hydroxymethylbilane synthase [Candidatus Melainabacteria bacterium]|nr:hydroxymethylbilane synthase [Candidatus Melainabacteria bacterium]